MNFVKKILFFVWVEAIVSYHAEVLVGNMNKHLSKEFSSGFINSDSITCGMIIIPPWYFIAVFVICDDSAFCHGRSACIAHHVGNTCSYIFREFSVFLLCVVYCVVFIKFIALILGVYIEATVIVFITLVYQWVYTWFKFCVITVMIVFLKKSVYFVLPCFS